MTGTEVERIGDVGPPSAEGFVVGKVLERRAAPERRPAQRLHGRHRRRRADDRLRRPQRRRRPDRRRRPARGARCRAARSCARRSCAGVASEGMILSAAELEVGEDADGIIVLDDEPGRRARRWPRCCRSAEPVLELEVTPNRIDCFGVYGVAREVHAITGAPLAADPWAEDAPAEGEGEVDDYASVTVEVPELCPRFTARVFTDVTIGPSPLWLQARLAAAGQRPINNVVDITNYVMLLTAQPLHAFDLDKVPGGELIVRTAERGREDDDPRRRRAHASTPRPCWSATRTAPPGSPGSWAARSPRSPTATTRVLLEVANWNGTNILRTSRLLGLRSEASSRFEKQLHPELCMRAQRIASRLMVELCGAKLVPGTIDVAAEIPAPRASCAARRRGSRALLGMRDRAGRPGRPTWSGSASGSRPTARTSRSTVPPERHYDVTREVDLIEEVGAGPRLRRAPADDAAGGRRRRSAASAASSGCGAGPRTRCATSASTRSSAGASPTPARPGGCGSPPSDPRASAVAARQPALRGPVGDAHDPARLAARRRRPQPRPRRRRASPSSSPAASTCTSADGPMPTAESARRPLAGFAGERPAPFAEPHRFAALAVGPLVERSWRGGGEPADFFALKGVLEALAAAARGRARVRAGRGAVPAPGPRGRGLDRRRAPPAGSARSTRWSAGPGTSRPRSASKSTPRR